MRQPVIFAALFAMLVAPAIRARQAPPSATYITSEEVQTVNTQPGTDRTIRVVDIGNENFAVGVIHRGATGTARGGGAGGAAGRAGAATAAQPRGQAETPVPQGATPGGIAHDSQTEGYLVISGGGTLATGGRIVNGSKSSATSAVTRELNGPSCSGAIAGDDVVKKVVKTGDIIIIPAGVPHGWTDIPDHVDYLSFRPSARVLAAGYVHPSIRK